MSDDFKGLLDAIESAMKEIEARRNLYFPASIIPVETEEEREAARRERMIASLSAITIIVEKWLPEFGAMIVKRESPLNRTGRDEIWMHPSALEYLESWIEAQAGAQELGEVA